MKGMSPHSGHLLSGPDLEKAVAEVRDWYVRTRLEAVSLMSKPYPYRSTPISPEEQYSNFTRLRPEDWDNMRKSLMRMYQGHPEASTLVDNELIKYRERMESYGQRINRGQPVVEEINL